MKNKIIFSIVLAIAFMLLLININSLGVTNIDYTISKFFGSLPPTQITQIAYVIGILFDTLPMIILCLLISVLLYTKSKKKEGIVLAISSVIGGALVYIIKNILQRARPFFQFVEETGYSYPSGHATIALILFGYLIVLASIYLKKKIQKRIAILGLVGLILMIGLSRIYLNVHWFSDVLGGYLLGSLVLIFATFSLSKSHSKF